MSYCTARSLLPTDTIIPSIATSKPSVDTATKASKAVPGIARPSQSAAQLSSATAPHKVMIPGVVDFEDELCDDSVSDSFAAKATQEAKAAAAKPIVLLRSNEPVSVTPLRRNKVPSLLLLGCCSVSTHAVL